MFILQCGGAETRGDEQTFIPAAYIGAAAPILYD
jgi:hypothetical protein